MKNLNYYPLKWIREKLGGGFAQAFPGERKSWKYLITDLQGEQLAIETNARHDITSVTFTPKYKGIGLSLKRAQRKGYKACWFYGLHQQADGIYTFAI